MAESESSTRIPTFCALCVSRCGAQATVEDGAFVALHPDPSHPTGRALCVKGKAGAGVGEPPPSDCCIRCDARHPKEPPTPAGSASAGTRRSTLSRHGCWRSPATTARSRSCSAPPRRRRRRCQTRSTGSPACGGRSAARTSVSTWSCAAGVVTWPRSTPTALPCRAATCPTSTAPAASCSGATTPRSPDSRMPRHDRRGAQPRCAAGRRRSAARRPGRAGPTIGCGCGRGPTQRWRCRSPTC